MTSLGPEERPHISRVERVEATSETGAGSLPREREKSIKIVTGGSLTEALGGGGAVVLAILGLAGVMPGYMAPIAVIAIGVALLAQGSAAAARWSTLVAQTRSFDWSSRSELGSGLSAELFGGGAGIVLGILSLLSIMPWVLIPVSLLVFGGTLLVGSGTTVDLGTMAGPGTYDQFGRVTREVSMAASGTQVLVGVGAIVLGILALVGVDPLILSLVGLLAIGASILLAGSAVSSRMLGMLRHR
jgi:hypothetical protein